MRVIAIACLATAACGFSKSLTQSSGDDAAIDAMPDAPPASPSVKFTTITSMTTQLRPGLYGIDVVATLHNGLPATITNVAASLTFDVGPVKRSADFRWRDLDMRENVATPQPTTIAPGADAVFRFRVDALPWATPPGPIEINGVATFLDGATPLSASPSDAPLMLGFVPLNPTIVVNEPSDESDADQNISFREALALAGSTSGIDRIVFDKNVFPATAPVTMVLSEALGELTIGSDMVIDGHGAGFIFAADSNWESPEGRYGLRITNGVVVVGGIGFRDMGYNYRNEGDLSANNCGASAAQLEGGAIRVDGGQVILEGNTFSDPNVAERNCYASSVRIEAGTRHRILNNTWTDQSMDAIYIDAATIEISGNVMNAGGNLNKVDECIYVNTQGTGPLWITNNICADMEYSAVIARGSDPGTLFVVNNTFVRNGRSGLSGVRREQGTRVVLLRNNVYVGNNPAAITLDNNGTGFDVAYESVTGSALFSGNASGATVNNATNITPANAMLVDNNGTTRNSLVPTATSPLVGSGVDFLDVNGMTPGHYNGTGAERGAIELP